jgi:hypothetical protein
LSLANRGQDRTVGTAGAVPTVVRTGDSLGGWLLGKPDGTEIGQLRTEFGLIQER